MRKGKKYQVWKKDVSSIDNKKESEPYLYKECKYLWELAIYCGVTKNRLTTLLSYGYGMWFSTQGTYQSFCVKLIKK